MKETRPDQTEAIKKKQNTTIQTNAKTYTYQAHGGCSDNFEEMR